MIDNNITITEAIRRVRTGEHPQTVLFEGADSAIIDSDSAAKIDEMLQDAVTLVSEAKTMYGEAYTASGIQQEDIAAGLNDLDEIEERLESIAALVKQNGALKDIPNDPTAKSPDQFRDPSKKEEQDEYEDEDEMEVPPITGADETQTPEGLEFNVNGVEDAEAFHQALVDLVSEHGGVLETEEEEDEGADYSTEDAKVIYKPVGKDTKLKDGKKPKDETSNPKGEADKAIKKLDSPAKKKAAPDYHESKLTAGLALLLKTHNTRHVRVVRP